MTIRAVSQWRFHADDEENLLSVLADRFGFDQGKGERAPHGRRPELVFRFTVELSVAQMVAVVLAGIPSGRRVCRRWSACVGAWFLQLLLVLILGPALFVLACVAWCVPIDVRSVYGLRLPLLVLVVLVVRVPGRRPLCTLLLPRFPAPLPLSLPRRLLPGFSLLAVRWGCPPQAEALVLLCPTHRHRHAQNK